MSRIAFVALLAVCTACGPDVPPQEPSSIARISIGMDVERAQAQLGDKLVPSWDLNGTFVVTDVRDAFTAALGAEIVRPLPGEGSAVRCAAALVAPDGEPNDAERVTFELRLRSDRGERVLQSAERGARDAAHAWTELEGSVDLDREPHASIVLVAKWSSTERMRVAWTEPRVVPAHASKLNVLVLSVDTLRADHLSSWGYARATSPHIDALIARGVRFENAISTAPWTLPSYGTLFTGLLPSRHRAGVSSGREAAFGTGRDAAHGDFEALTRDATTLAECFRSRGFASAGIVSNPYLDSVTGIDRGFDTWVQYLNRAAAGIEIAQRWIARQGEQPWFLFLHLVDPHGPYVPPSPYDERYSGRKVHEIAGYPPSLEELRARMPDAATRKLLVDLYDGEIAYVDEQIGKLVDFLEQRGELARTLIVFHSDHGEEFWEHGSCEHGLTLFDEVLHVPLAFVWPGTLPAGARIAERTSLVDAFPTILDLCGIPVPAGLDGQSLKPQCLGQTLAPRDCFAESLLYGPCELKSVSNAREALITDASKSRSWFDLATDPFERNDVAREHVERVDALESAIAARRIHADAVSGSTLPAPDAARLERIRALGYAGVAREPRRDGPGSR